LLKESSDDDDETIMISKRQRKVFGPNKSPKNLHKNVAEAEVDAEVEDGDDEDGEDLCGADSGFTCGNIRMDEFFRAFTDHNEIYFYEGSNTIPNCA